ncbi:HIT domain-containing protein [bacterium]|nr:HIT domain-containing protein [bacterium]
MVDDYLYSPWRLNYILSEKEKGCIFCLKPDQNDDPSNGILYRSKYCFVIQNLYPYNNGHIMVVPYKHVSSLYALNPDELTDLFATVRIAEKVLTDSYHCEGMNIGINEGKAAGAGIAEHIHVHLVPRWIGDVNFMTVVGGKRVIPEAFEVTYRKLKEQFDKFEG